MARPPSQPELLRRLVALAKSEEDPKELDQFLRVHSAALSEALCVPDAELAALVDIDPSARGRNVQKLIREGQAAHKQQRVELNQNLALAAATMLSGLARWHDDRIDLDARIVLGNLLRDGTKKAIRFDAEKLGRTTVLRAKLSQVRRTLKAPDLRCFLDERGLNFRWNSEKGGLVLVDQKLPRQHRQSFVPVVLTRQRPKSPLELELAPRRSWIGQALSDIALV